MIKHWILIFFVLQLCSCKQTSPSNNTISGKPEDNITYKDVTVNFLAEASHTYQNSYKSQLQINASNKQFSFSFSPLTIVQAALIPTDVCLPASGSCLCKTNQQCFKVQISPLACGLTLTAQIDHILQPSVFAMPNKIFLSNISAEVTYSDSVVESATANKWGTFPEQQKYYCSQLSNTYPASGSNSFDFSYFNGEIEWPYLGDTETLKNFDSLSYSNETQFHISK